MKIEILCWRCLHPDVNVMREKNATKWESFPDMSRDFAEAFPGKFPFPPSFGPSKKKTWLSSRKQSPSFYASLLCENSRYGCAKPARSCISLPPEKVNLPLFIFWQRKMFNFFRGSVISEIARISFLQLKRKKYGGGKD